MVIIAFFPNISTGNRKNPEYFIGRNEKMLEKQIIISYITKSVKN